MAVHDRAELDHVRRRVRSTTIGSLMSDTKWRKVFAAIQAHQELELRQCIIKFIDSPEERIGNPGACLHVPRPWVDTTSFGPIPLRSIEWLLFPRIAEYQTGRTTPAHLVRQDVDGAMRVLTGLGQLPLEMTERGLIIRGYIRTA
ncbi:DUF6678 family protein [Asticcacaulis sp. 201]|uniref:DUF6678 family protein n=1 Tax=Asticcacaulis sp. 201 TaxID=3028787 RepID=UPI003983C000